MFKAVDLSHMLEQLLLLFLIDEYLNSSRLRAKKIYAWLYINELRVVIEMSYLDDQYKLIDKSNAELHNWIALQEQGSKEYVAGIQESMRRVAAIEQEMEKNEAPVWRRESIAMGVSILAIAIFIIAIVVLSE